jgi:hypothetical protein
MDGGAFQDNWTINASAHHWVILDQRSDKL